MAKSIGGIPVPSTRMLITGAIATIVTLWLLNNTGIGNSIKSKLRV